MSLAILFISLGCCRLIAASRICLDCMDGQQQQRHGLTKADTEALSGSILEVAGRFARTPICFHKTHPAEDTQTELEGRDDDAVAGPAGWSLTLLRYLTESVIGQNGLVGPRSATSLLQSALASILNPLAALEFPRLRHYLNILFYLLFTVCFVSLQRDERDLLALSSVDEETHAEKRGELMFFRVYVAAQCMGMILTAGRIASRYSLSFVLGDFPVLLDCCIAVLIMIGDGLLIFVESTTRDTHEILVGDPHDGLQQAGYFVLCCTNLVLGIRYLDFLRSIEDLAPLVHNPLFRTVFFLFFWPFP